VVHLLHQALLVQYKGKAGCLSVEVSVNSHPCCFAEHPSNNFLHKTAPISPKLTTYRRQTASPLCVYTHRHTHTDLSLPDTRFPVFGSIFILN